MEKYGAVLQTAKAAVIVYGSDRVVLEWNAGAERLFGFAPAEAIGKALDALLDTHASEQEVRVATRKDGTRRHCQWQETALDDGSVFAFVTDVTETRSRERLMQSMLENLAVVVWQVDTKGTFTYQDGPKALAQFAMKPGQLVGMNIFELYGETGRGVVDDALRGKPTYTDGEEHGRVFQTWTIPLFADDGTVDAAAGVSLDVTDMRKGEHELRAKLALIERQEKTIRELSIPLIETWDGVLTVPMVGVVDTERAADVMEQLLSEITRRKARFAIVDLTGVEAVDTKVAAHIISLTRAIQLLGAEGIVTGIRPSTAQTMMALGADLAGIHTRANLKEALRYCIQKLESSK
jgi:rsbT co-antagonist protein RsbR